MDAELTHNSTTDSIPPVENDRIRRLSMLMPLLMSLASRRQIQQQESPSDADHGVGFRILMVHSRTCLVLWVEGTGDIDSLFEHLSSKSGVSLASKASIEAMPRVVMNDIDAECAICLDTYEDVGGEAREMPCMHRFHSACIEKWLGIRGSCPVCRFQMPAVEKRENSSEVENGGGEEGGHRRQPAFTLRMWMRTRSSGRSPPMNADLGSVSESGEGSTATTPSTHYI